MEKPPKTAIIGAKGLVGRTLFEAYRQLYPGVVGTDWKGRDRLLRVDLGDPATFPADLTKSGHAWAVICAGIRDFQKCEQDPALTRDRNVIGTVALSRYLQEQGLKVALFSSDGVFDGERGGYSDEAPQQPVNEYGRQKKELEARA